MPDNRVVVEVNTVERTERRYLVEMVVPMFMPDEEIKGDAEEKVRCGEIHKFTEGNADIEEVISVEIRRES